MGTLCPCPKRKPTKQRRCYQVHEQTFQLEQQQNDYDTDDIQNGRDNRGVETKENISSTDGSQNQLERKKKRRGHNKNKELGMGEIDDSNRGVEAVGRNSSTDNLDKDNEALSGSLYQSTVPFKNIEDDVTNEEMELMSKEHIVVDNVEQEKEQDINGVHDTNRINTDQKQSTVVNQEDTKNPYNAIPSNQQTIANSTNLTTPISNTNYLQQFGDYNNTNISTVKQETGNQSQLNNNNIIDNSNNNNNNNINNNNINNIQLSLIETSQTIKTQTIKQDSIQTVTITTNTLLAQPLTAMTMDQTIKVAEEFSTIQEQNVNSIVSNMINPLGTVNNTLAITPIQTPPPSNNPTIQNAPPPQTPPSNPNILKPKNQPPRKKLNLQDYRFINEQNQFKIKPINSLNQQQFNIDKCINCIYYIFDVTGNVYLDDCRDCYVYIAPCQGSIFVRNCKNMMIVGATKQFRTYQCHRSIFSLYCKSQPVIQSSSQLQFRPLTAIPPYKELFKQFSVTQLNVWNNHWSEIFNFTKKVGEIHYKLTMKSLDELQREWENSRTVASVQFNNLNVITNNSELSQSTLTPPKPNWQMAFQLANLPYPPPPQSKCPIPLVYGEYINMIDRNGTVLSRPQQKQQQQLQPNSNIISGIYVFVKPTSQQQSNKILDILSTPTTSTTSTTPTTNPIQIIRTNLGRIHKYTQQKLAIWIRYNPSVLESLPVELYSLAEHIYEEQQDIKKYSELYFVTFKDER